MNFKDKRLLIIMAILITEVLGFSLILPFLPLFAQDMGASPLVIGLILTAFSIFQFLSAPIMGRLSDFYGRRPLLIISQVSTLLSFIILGFANSLWMIFLSRIVDGLFGSNFSISQAYLSDISSKKDRAKVLGFSGVAFGFGFLVGPAIGGFFSQYGYAVPSFIAAGLSLLTVILTLFKLPETVKHKEKVEIQIKFVDVSAISKYFSNSLISNKLWQYFFYFLAHSTWVSAYALFAEKQLSYGVKEIGYTLAYIGLVSIIMRGYAIPRLIDKFGENKLRNNSVVLMLLGLVLFAFVKTGLVFLLSITIYAYAMGVARPLLTAIISKSVSQKEQGVIMGVTNSLGSLGQIIAPLIGGFLLTSFEPKTLPLTAAFFMMIVWWFNNKDGNKTVREIATTRKTS